MNVLKLHLRTTVETLLGRGVSHREIERRTGVDRKTIRRYARSANSSTPATGSPDAIEANSPALATGSGDESGPSCSMPDHAWSQAAGALVSPDRRALQVSVTRIPITCQWRPKMSHLWRLKMSHLEVTSLRASWPPDDPFCVVVEIRPALRWV